MSFRFGLVVCLTLISCSAVFSAKFSLNPAARNDTVQQKIFNFLARSSTTIAPSKSELCECGCGIRNDAGRIVGGQETATNEYPWMARLSYFNRFYCAGTLINDRYIVTAAHCVKGFIWFLIKVTFGEHDRCSSTRKPETRFVLRSIAGEFSFTNFQNDIALLRLNDRVPFTDTIRPICLPAKEDVSYENILAIATGWGTLAENGKASCTLQEVKLPYVNHEQCVNNYHNTKVITDHMICAGAEEGLKDTCQGDSGGPLIRVRDDKRYELIGVVSFGYGCGRPGYPGVYTRVNHYVQWIKEHTREGCYCADVFSVVNLSRRSKLSIICHTVGSSYIVSEQISREDADNRLGGLEDFRAELEMLTKEWCVPCRCGMPNRNKTRIVGGVETVAHEFPWMAELQIRGRFFCGGALINDRYILTAGHCLRGDFNLQELTVVLGEHDRNDPKDSKVLVKSVSEVIIHPKYDPTTPKMHDNDLALLKLSSPVMLNSNIKPVCLPPQGISFNGKRGTVAGWGKTSETGSTSPTLRKVQVPVLSNEGCAKLPGFDKSLTKNMMCAGLINGGKDSCQGDSGGALLAESKTQQRAVVAGIVSWGVGCARAKKPGVYTRVNRYLKWIAGHTQDACYCL
nr:PREDICTED: transmembrane protease serine 9-like [Bemisia tabaci]